ncbi:hypothetical protein [Anaerosporobacter sp.]|uniref:hypothetical protein n=1 Tax=Anaerosporobacter sp. TaxID=1872529 RepID=UPI00286EBCFC|nr:hypothetical protein [Anaerosporobacter sp.]
MEKHTEKRGDYNVSYYTVAIDQHMRNIALDFAKRIILSDNQYSRLLPIEVRNSKDVSIQHKIEIQRTFMGKLGEMAFLKLLQEKNKEVNIDGMFEVFEGQGNVDSFDFQTSTGFYVDVKTGFRNIHKRLLINVDQFDNIPKDFYVAVKVDALDTDSRLKLVDWDDISTAKIIGYADYSYIKKNASVYDFGEGQARWLYYEKLMGIDRLLSMF